jgi:hypothetical protein
MKLMKGWLQLIGGIVVVAVLIASPTVKAQERVAVLGFSGPQAGSARAAVIRAVRQEYELVDLREWQRVAQQLNARGTSPRALATVAQELGVKAIVTGGVQRVRRQFSLGVVVRDGADGSIIGREGRAMMSLSRAGATGAALGRRVVEMIREARGASGEGRPRRPDPEPEPEDQDDEYQDDEYDEPEPGDERNTPDYSAIEDERPPIFNDDDGEAPQVEDEEPRQAPRSGDRDRRRDADRSAPRSSGRTSPFGWLELGVEINGASRTFAVPINQVIDTSGRDEARFESSVFPEFGARLAFYPGGVFTDNWASGIGIEGSFHHHIFLRVLNRRRNEEVKSEEYAFSVGATYRIAIGHADRGLTLWPRAGFARFSFFLGDEGTDIVPPFAYDHLYIGLNAYIPLATRYIGIDLGADYLAVLTIGEYATSAYNESGALPTTHGFQFLVGLSGQIVAGLRWRVAFEMLGFISHHQGVGQGWGHEPTTRMEDPLGAGIQTLDAAKDIFFRLMPQLVYRFGWRPGDQGGSTERRGGADEPRDGSNPGDGARGSWYDDGESRPDDDEGRTDDDWGEEDW